MSSKHNAASCVLAVCALATLSLTTVVGAQPNGPGRGGPGYMMGPGMMDRQEFGRMCGPRSAGFAEWRIDRLERVVKPTESQRAKFDEFKAASNKAAETMRAACPTDVPATMVGRMEATEKRLDAMLQAVKSVRPALEAFYATLSDEQKASLNTGSRREQYWRWRDRLVAVKDCDRISGSSVPTSYAPDQYRPLGIGLRQVKQARRRSSQVVVQFSIQE